jgi:endo-1,4-beta-xylanase
MQRRALFTGSIATAMWSSVIWPFSVLDMQSEGLRATAIAKSMLVGSAVSAQQLVNPQLRGFINEQCNILAPENQMQWSQVHPEPDRYDFAAADELTSFAKENAMALYGRTLCQHLELPPWVVKEATAENAGQLLGEHVETVVGRYVGRIHSWDVVREAVEPGDHRDDGMRNSLWMKLLGLRYIAIAFRAAAQADPRAILTYSERGLVDDSENSHHRRLITIGFLRWFRTNHIPIHALSLQSHLRARYDYLPDWSGLHAFLKEVGKLELQVFITELDVDDTDLSARPEKREKQVAELCKDYLDNVLKHPGVTAVLTSQPVSHPAEIVNDFGETEKRHIALPLSEDSQPTPFLSAMSEAMQKRRNSSR